MEQNIKKGKGKIWKTVSCIVFSLLKLGATLCLCSDTAHLFKFMLSIVYTT